MLGAHGPVFINVPSVMTSRFSFVLHMRHCPPSLLMLLRWASFSCRFAAPWLPRIASCGIRSYTSSVCRRLSGRVSSTWRNQESQATGTAVASCWLPACFSAMHSLLQNFFLCRPRTTTMLSHMTHFTSRFRACPAVSISSL